MIEITLLCQLQLMPPAQGLQILAGLCRDARTASLVNVLPGENRKTLTDAVVAEHAKPNVPDSVKPYMDRKTVKRVVMTVPYNAKPHSNRHTSVML